jgi:hypothetical protein
MQTELETSTFSEDNKKIFFVRKVKKQNYWTNEEDEILLNAVQNIYKGKKWNLVSKLFKNKNQAQCLTRYNRIRPDKQKVGWNKFSKEEDQIIADYVKNVGKNWTKIALILKIRNGKQVRDRYINYLDNSYNKEVFTPEEDNLIVQSYLELGTKWSQIAKRLVKRTSDMVKNRFYSFHYKRIHPVDYEKKYKTKFVSKNTRLDKVNTVKHKKYFIKLKCKKKI